MKTGLLIYIAALAYAGASIIETVQSLGLGQL